MKEVFFGTLFGLANTSVFLLWHGFSSHWLMLIAPAVLCCNAWLYVLYCHRNGSCMLLAKKITLGYLYVGVLCLTNLYCNNSLIGKTGLNAYNVFIQLVIVPVISCYVTLMICRFDELIKTE
ncbi:hypothetical protein [Desulforamulus hydrothermalis]|uniref:Uncharacterized protein n=1 Tax=Desulforamulus hydrothermalis Lam5 = DSM 18033 TaxID=1121428 RepID=K8EA96_9FIRM|nr:hypothetical protein [Desulforamulus hydrothermalis]CCO08523.1 conserved membrane hypothetical protein [Desulforamulus hydrothermalis Lam5 = DSM 18033]SHH50206.1 hypothetical protein SAMN02745177_02698 [Desulforamulus hydrothermalis Lam5 = DSM 18033]